MAVRGCLAWAPAVGIDMTKNRPNPVAGGAHRARAVGLLMAVCAGCIASLSGVASCASQGYYESKAAVRTAYEAAESARRASDAATVAAIELRLSNDRLGEAADKLRDVITAEGFGQRVIVGEKGADTQPAANGTQPEPANSPKGNGNPESGTEPDPRQSDGTQNHAAETTEADSGVQSNNKPLSNGTNNDPGSDVDQGTSFEIASSRGPRGGMFDLDLAFGATAFLAMVVISWWAGEARAKVERVRDWLPVSAAACAAMVSIALAGTAYFGVRIFHDGPTPGLHRGVPWFVMAWVWCGMVGVGLLVMWVNALAGFWNRVGLPGGTEPDVRAGRADGRPDAWRLWMSVLVIGALPAAGLLYEGRFALLLFMLLVAVYGVFAGMAMLATARDEARVEVKPVLP